MIRVCLGCVLYTAPGALATVDRVAWTAQIASRGARGGAGVWGAWGWVFCCEAPGGGAGVWGAWGWGVCRASVVGRTVMIFLCRAFC
jgi:hypothetical protein